MKQRPATFPKRFQPEITDHAVVRWLEHVHGLNTADVRREILGEHRGEWLASGPFKLRVPRLHVSLVVKNGVVVTILPHAKQGRAVP